MSDVKLRIRHGSQNATLTLLDSSTMSDLINEIKKVLKNDDLKDLDLLMGYPPKPINLSELCSTLTEANIKSGESIIVKPSLSNGEQQSKKPKLEDELIKNVDSMLSSQTTFDSKIMIKITIPSDNSCLFASIQCCLNNGSLHDYDSASDRRIIADNVLSDPVKYNRAFLDNKSGEEYAQWILDKDHWGGALEISLLSQVFRVEIDVVNAQHVRIDRFGEDSSWEERVLILYDGIHYDALGIEDVNNGRITTKFQTSDDTVLPKALELAQETKGSRQFTDVNRFTIRCQQCGCLFTGQEMAVKHATATGHQEFGEVNDDQ